MLLCERLAKDSDIHDHHPQLSARMRSIIMSSRPRRIHLLSRVSPRLSGYSTFNYPQAPIPQAAARRCQLGVPHHNPRAQWKRGAKTTSKMKLGDLPQGLLDGEGLPPLPEEIRGSTEYPTVIQQARNNMRRFSKCLLLTRVGGFYELYFEHADEVGPLLGLKVVKRRTSGGAVSMVRLINWIG